MRDERQRMGEVMSPEEMEAKIRELEVQMHVHAVVLRQLLEAAPPGTQSALLAYAKHLTDAPAIPLPDEALAKIARGVLAFSQTAKDR